MAARSLDIAEMQTLVEFPGDPNGLDYHHRIFWYRIDRSVWIFSTLDYDVYEEDYDGVAVVPFPLEIVSILKAMLVRCIFPEMRS